MELADRTDVFAKGPALKKAIDQQGCQEISENDPGGQPWTVPKAERFVSPEIEGDQEDWQPFVPQ